MESDMLANQIFTEQVKYGFTSLATETETICEEMGLMNTH